MNNLQISSWLAVVIGIVMFIWGTNLTRQMHHKSLVDQTDGEFIVATALTMGGALIALIAAFGAGRSSHGGKPTNQTKENAS
jgi:hypothetical protein